MIYRRRVGRVQVSLWMRNRSQKRRHELVPLGCVRVGRFLQIGGDDFSGNCIHLGTKCSV